MAVLKLLRNQSLYATHEAALDAINKKALDLGDGEMWIATYGEAPNAKSILALKRTDGLTVFDNETSSDSITAAISQLHAPDTPKPKHFVTSVSETNGIISVSRGAVTSNDDTVTITAGDNGGIDLAVNIDGKTIKKSSGKLTVDTVSAAKVSVAAGTGLEATNAQAAFKELKDEIDTVAVGAKKYTIERQNTGLATNVKEQYVLKEIVGETKTPVGVPIQIYKDSAYKEIYLGTANDTIDTKTGKITKVDGDKQSLNYAYMKADGSYDLVKVDVSNFLAESEFKDGLVVTDHVVKVQVDKSSEKFLTVGEAGVKLSGVQDAINTAKAAATTKVVEGTDAGNNLKIDATTSDADGSTTYTINLSDVASKTALEAEIAARKAVDGQDGPTYVANAGTNYISEATSLNNADIKLDAELKKEVTRAQAAEKEIADKVGLTGDEGTRVFGPTTNYGTGTATVKANMQAIDSALKAVDDAMLTGITESNAISVSTKANKNQTVTLKLDTTTKPTGFTNADNVLSITDNGLYLSSIIDCGTY